MIDRRSLLKFAGLAPLMGAVPRLARAADEVTTEKADYTLRIGSGLVELAPEHVVSPSSITASFRDRCCASGKGNGSSSTTTPIRQAGPVYIEPKNNPGAYDREVFLVMKEFAPAFSRGGDMAMDVLAGPPLRALQEMGKAADEEAQEKTRASKSVTSCSASMAECLVTANNPSA